jgi:hypothetical protein
MNKYVISKVFLILFFLGLTLNTHAALVTCSATTLGLVEHASACQRSTTEDQDFLNTNPTTVNSEAFFGYADWAFLKKDDPLANGQTGTWSLSSDAWSNYANIMLIFKDGNDTTLLGFLLTPTFTSGDWDSPFTVAEFGVGLCGYDKNGQPKEPNCDKIKDVSHVSYYGRGTPSGEEPPPPTRVSEPSALLLMLLGFAGLAFARRQRL